MSIYDHTDFNHSLLEEVVIEFLKLPEVKDTPLALEDLSWKIENWRKGIYKLVLVGEVSKGKSSLVNALLEDHSLTPVAARVASAVPIRITYGKKTRFRVHFLSELAEEAGQRTEPLEISPEDLDRYATETGTGDFFIDRNAGNQNNQLGVNYISIEHPHPLLKEGLSIVDLPGIGGVVKKHTRLVREYLHPKRADHILFVLDSTGSPLTKEEADVILQLKEKGMDQFIFVQTKIDGPDIDVVQQFEVENKRQIGKVLDVDPESIDYYFPVSSKLKLDWLESKDEDDLQDSNFPALEDYLFKELIPTNKDRLAFNFVVDIDSQLRDLYEGQEAKLSNYKIESMEKLKEISSDLKDKRVAMLDWQRTQLPRIKSRLNGNLDKARDRFDDSLHDSLNERSMTRNVLRDLERGNPSVKQIEAASNTIFEDIKDAALEAAQRCNDEFLEDVSNALVDAADDMEQSLPEAMISGVYVSDGSATMDPIKFEGGRFDKLRNIVGAGALGGALWHAIPAAVLGVIALPGVVIGAVITAIFALGGKASHEKRVADQALSKLKGGVKDAYRELHTNLNRASRSNRKKIEIALSERFNETIESKLSMLNDQINNIQKLQSESQQERQQNEALLARHLAKLINLHAKLEKSVGEVD